MSAAASTQTSSQCERSTPRRNRTPPSHSRCSRSRALRPARTRCRRTCSSSCRRRDAGDRRRRNRRPRCSSPSAHPRRRSGTSGRRARSRRTPSAPRRLGSSRLRARRRCSASPRRGTSCGPRCSRRTRRSLSQSCSRRMPSPSPPLSLPPSLGSSPSLLASPLSPTLPGPGVSVTVPAPDSSPVAQPARASAARATWATCATTRMGVSATRTYPVHTWKLYEIKRYLGNQGPNPISESEPGSGSVCGSGPGSGSGTVLRLVILSSRELLIAGGSGATAFSGDPFGALGVESRRCVRRAGVRGGSVWTPCQGSGAANTR